MQVSKPGAYFFVRRAQAAKACIAVQSVLSPSTYVDIATTNSLSFYLRKFLSEIG